jgi:hypothetical protein
MVTPFAESHHGPPWKEYCRYQLVEEKGKCERATVSLYLSARRRI